MVLCLAAVAALGLYGFSSFRAAIVDLSELEIPKIIQGSRLAESANQLIFEVERLAAADSDADRRIAAAAVDAQLDVIVELSETEELEDANPAEAILVLDSTLSELDGLVASRLEWDRRFEAFNARLWSLPGRAVDLHNGLRASVRDAASVEALSLWLDDAVAVISMAGESAMRTGLKQAKEIAESLRTRMQVLAGLSGRLPPAAGRDLETFEAELRSALFDAGGLVPMLEERADIARRSAARSNFARSLVVDFRAASGKLSNGFVNAAAEGAARLTRIVGRALAIYVVALAAAAVAFVVAIARFRKRLIVRLVTLNSAILRHVAGHEEPVPVDGDDEITDMARSFLYYVGEVDRREAELRELATKDALTGIANRRHFLETAERELHRAERYGHPAAFLMLDIDHFKDVNDTLGHAAGDEVLKAAVDACGSRLRAVDILGRIGGEEFAVLMPETDADQGMVAAERIREAVSAAGACVGDRFVSCTTSIGLASAPGSGYDLGALMKAADGALYEAKLAGRDRVRRAAG